MKTYTEIQHVRILGSVMQYRDLPTVVLEAMRLLRVAADIHLKNRRTPAEQAEIDQPPDNGTIPDPHAGQQSGQQSTGSSSAKRKKLDTAIYFRPFVTLLQHLQERYTEPELKKAASETLSYLQALLPVVPTPTGSSTPGSSHDQTQGIPLAGN